MMPKVDTFEHDISDEIKRKEASLAEISSASNNVGNDPVELPKRTPIFFIVVSTFFVLSIVGFVILGYFYYTTTFLAPPPLPPEPVAVIPKTTTDLVKVSPTISGELSRYVTSVEKRDKGYVITINNYSAVFAYITRNELSYIEELALLFPSNTKQQASTSTQKVAPQTPTPSATASSSNATTTVIATSTTAKTKTQVNKASTSPVTSSTTITQISSPVILAQPVKPVEEISFSDITIDNQNMRVWNEGGKSVVYAFIGNSYLVIANTKEDLLALKSAILK